MVVLIKHSRSEAADDAFREHRADRLSLGGTWRDGTRVPGRTHGEYQGGDGGGAARHRRHGQGRDVCGARGHRAWRPGRPADLADLGRWPGCGAG